MNCLIVKSMAIEACTNPKLSIFPIVTQFMPFLLLHIQFLIFLADINLPEYFIAPSANYSTLSKT